MSNLIQKFSNHFTRYTTPINSMPREGLSYWREKILLYIIYIITVFAFIAYIPSIILSVHSKLWLIVIVDTAAYIFLFFLFFSKSLSVRTRAISILALAYPLSVTLLITIGPYGAGYIWLFVVPILSAILMNARTAFYSILLNMVTLIAIGFWIQNNASAPFIRMYFSFDSWLVIISNLTFLEIIITLSIVIITQGLEKSLFNERKISRSLELQTEELAKAKYEAEMADAMKSEFLAQMSHEIRTPINTILNSTSMLRESYNEFSDNDRKEIFGMIQTGSSRLIRTIDLILNMSEIQTGSYKKTIEPISLVGDILAPLISEFCYNAEQKKLKLFIVPSSIKEHKFTGDRYAVTQIFANLIDNAIKYTNAGSVEIGLRNDCGSIIVDVIDTGIGISKEYLSAMFKPFSQEETGYTRHFDGNGLGLALVKKYCEINDAEIFVESEKGKGSKFSVRFKNESIQE